MAFRLARPRHLVDINGVAGLDRLEVENGKLCIGATVRHAAFERPITEGPLGRLMAEIVRHIAHHPIRTRGTFCGSIAHADPASEWCALAALLDAEMVAVSVRGARVIRAVEFFEGIMTTALKEDEILAEVRLPLLRADVRFGFCEFNRRAGDFAIGMAIAIFRMQGGTIAEARVAVGAIEGAPRRILEAEYAVKARAPSADSFSLAAELVAKRVEPLDDANTSAAYRRDLIRVLVPRALEQAAA
jgi:carbon-monoxide dehydrogenase medium subunit